MIATFLLADIYSHHLKYIYFKATSVCNSAKSPNVYATLRSLDGSERSGGGGGGKWLCCAPSTNAFTRAARAV